MAQRRTRMKSRGNNRYIRRNERGQFKEVEDVGRASARDQKRKAKSPAKRGQGDRGDRSSK